VFFPDERKIFSKTKRPPAKASSLLPGSGECPVLNRSILKSYLGIDCVWREIDKLHRDSFVCEILCITHKIALNIIFVKQKDTGIPEKKSSSWRRILRCSIGRGEGARKTGRDLTGKEGESILGGMNRRALRPVKKGKRPPRERWPQNKNVSLSATEKILLNPKIVNSDNPNSILSQWR